MRPAVRKEDRHYYRGPTILSPQEVERLVKLGDKVDHARFERKRKREELKSVCKKLQEDVRKFVEDEVCYSPDEVHCRSFSRYTSMKKELQDLGLDIRKTHTQEEAEIYSIKFEFTF